MKKQFHSRQMTIRHDLICQPLAKITLRRSDYMIPALIIISSDDSGHSNLILNISRCRVCFSFSHIFIIIISSERLIGWCELSNRTELFCIVKNFIGRKIFFFFFLICRNTHEIEWLASNKACCLRNFQLHWWPNQLAFDNLESLVLQVTKYSFGRLLEMESRLVGWKKPGKTIYRI